MKWSAWPHPFLPSHAMPLTTQIPPLRWIILICLFKATGINWASVTYEIPSTRWKQLCLYLTTLCCFPLGKNLYTDCISQSPFHFLDQGTRGSFQYHTIRLPGRFQVSPLGEKKANHIPLWIFSNPFNMLIFIMNLQQVGIEFATVPKLISLQNLSFHGFPQDQHPTKYTLEKSVWKAVLCLCTTALSTNSLWPVEPVC